MNGKQPPKKSGAREALRALSLFSQIGITMAACVLVGVWLGVFADRLLGTSPFLLLGLSLLGVAAAFKAVFDLINKNL